MNAYVKKFSSNLPIILPNLALIIYLAFDIFNGMYGNRYSDDWIFWGFILTFLLTGIWMYFRIKGETQTHGMNDRLMLKLLVIVASLSIIIPYLGNPWWWDAMRGGPLSDDPNYRILINIGMGLILIIIVTYILEPRFTRFEQLRYPILLILIFLVKYYVINSFPKPIMDVYDIQTLGPTYLLNGTNPYSATYTKINFQTPNYFAYPPGMLVLLLPIRAAGFDIRFFYLIVQFGLCFVIYYGTHATSRSEIISLIPLINPNSIFFLNFVWTEQLLIFFIAILIFYGQQISSIKRGLIVGFTLTLKQTMWLLYPFYVIYLTKSERNIKEIVISLSIFAGIMVPFMLWNFGDFYYDIWTFHTLQDSARSMTINAYLSRNYPSVEVNSDLFLIAFSLIVLHFNSRIKPNDDRRNWNIVLIYFILGLFTFYLLSDLAYMNHYYLIQTMIFLLFAERIKGESP